jgi:hypothetical protein
MPFELAFVVGEVVAYGEYILSIPVVCVRNVISSEVFVCFQISFVDESRKKVNTLSFEAMFFLCGCYCPVVFYGGLLKEVWRTRNLAVSFLLFWIFCFVVLYLWDAIVYRCINLLPYSRLYIVLRSKGIFILLCIHLFGRSIFPCIVKKTHLDDCLWCVL